MNFVDLSLKINDRLINIQVEAQRLAEGTDFAEKYHNGRIDGIRESLKIVEEMLLSANDEPTPKGTIDNSHFSAIVQWHDRWSCSPVSPSNACLDELRDILK